MDDQEALFKKIDTVINCIDSNRKEPDFSIELKKREQRNPNLLGDESETLRRFARLIAFSQNAKSGLVIDMLDAGKFEKVFNNFDVNYVARMNPELITKSSLWEEISVIRFPIKVNSIIKCAQTLQSISAEYGSFVMFLTNFGIPSNLNSGADIDVFWNKFKDLKSELAKLKMPFFKNTTSLLHLLLHVGYPCLKPDLIVMNEALKFGGVKSTKKTPQNLRQAVTFFQYYSVSRKIKPVILDFYLLVDGGQDWAKRFINQNYYSTSPKPSCHD
jgi:3-methyladenine DNA glycosylase Tag